MTKWGERLRYRFDNIISRGTGAMVAALALLSLAIVAISGALVALTGVHPVGSDPISFTEGAWLALMRTLDAGTMGGDTGWGFRGVMFLTTVGGILIISTLIGVLANGIQNKIEELRRGRSRVIEEGHTVILGWTEQVFTIIPEIIEANANQKHGCIVVLGDQDKVMMEETIKQRVGPLRNTQIVCRTGNPIEQADLRVTSLNSSKSIIILSPEEDDSDAEVIKTALAIMNLPDRRVEPFHIVAELKDYSSLEAAHVVGKEEVEWVVVSDFVARVIAQTCHQSGLSVIYTELLDFQGDEVYFHQAPTLVGKTFGQALTAFEINALLGICDQEGRCTLNPAADTIISAADRLILIAEDDDKIVVNAARQLPAGESRNIADAPAGLDQPRRLLILGWNALGPTIIRELACYMPDGSQVTVIATTEDVQSAIAQAYSEPGHTLAVTCQQGNTTDRHTLEGMNLGQYDHIVVLCYSDQFSNQKADAQTLITLLHLRDIADKHGYQYSIVSQMMDVRNRNLAAMTRADDFIVSDRLISLMMAQVSENKCMNAVFADLFNPEGSEIYLKPVEEYIRIDEPATFYTIVEAALRKHETAIGYRCRAQEQDKEHAYGIHLNPRKSEPISYASGDRVIVLAES